MRHYWKCRLVKGGPEVPAMTMFDGPMIEGEILDRSPRWQCVVRLETTARPILLGDATPVEVEGITLLQLNQIDEATYRYMIDYAQWAETHAPHLPQAKPYRKLEKLKGGAGVW